MKKVLLSAALILVFAFYVIRQKSVLPVDNNTTASVSTPKSQNVSSAGLKNGEYTGDVTDAYYGNVQVKIVTSGGKIIDVQFLDYPHDRRTSEMINSQAMPMLKQEAITAQNAQVDIVSGATQTSLAFKQSLQSALNKAQ